MLYMRPTNPLLSSLLPDSTWLGFGFISASHNSCGSLSGLNTRVNIWCNSSAHLNGFTCHPFWSTFEIVLSIHRAHPPPSPLPPLTSPIAYFCEPQKCFKLLRKAYGGVVWGIWGKKNFRLSNAYFKCQVLNCGRRVCQNVRKLLQLLLFAICYFPATTSSNKTRQQSGL